MPNEHQNSRPFTVEHDRALHVLKHNRLVVANNPEEERILAEIAANGFARKQGNAYVATGNTDLHQHDNVPRRSDSDNVGRLQGIWLSKKALHRGAVALLVVVGFAVVWASMPSPVPKANRLPALSQKELAKVELRDAVDKGLIRFSAFGSGLESVRLSVESDSDEPLEVTIRAGTFFRATSHRGQDVVTGATRSFALMKRGTRHDVVVAAACVNMHKDAPTEADELTLSHSEPSADLAKLVSCPDFHRQTFRVQQFAVWTITDNPDSNEFVGIVGEDRPDSNGSPSPKELQDIRALLEQARIPMSRYRIFSHTRQ